MAEKTCANCGHDHDVIHCPELQFPTEIKGNPASMADRLLSPAAICALSTNSMCDHCTCRESGKPEIVPCQIYDDKLIIANFQDAKTAKAVNEDWVKWIEEHRMKSYCNDRPIIFIETKDYEERKKECGL